MYGVRDVLLGLSVLLCLAVGGLVYYQHQRITALQEQADAASALVAGYKARDTAAATLNKRKEKTDARANEVLTLYEGWANEPVPDDVADLLRKH